MPTVASVQEAQDAANRASWNNCAFPGKLLSDNIAVFPLLAFCQQRQIRRNIELLSINLSEMLMRRDA